MGSPHWGALLHDQEQAEARVDLLAGYCEAGFKSPVLIKAGPHQSPSGLWWAVVWCPHERTRTVVVWDGPRPDWIQTPSQFYRIVYHPFSFKVMQPMNLMRLVCV
jgi:hypothetical protein